jgi:LysR family nod box-dependent transcriptional activator
MAQLDLNLNLLNTLDVLLQEESVNRTAARFGISQAAVSVQLAKLRVHFADELLVTKGRRLVKTPFAESLVAPIRELINNARSIIGLRQSFDPATSDRVFHINAGDIDSVILLPALLRHLHDSAPGIQVHVHGSTSEPAKIDFFIRPLGLHDPLLPACRLYEDHYCVLGDAAHPALAGTFSASAYFEQRHVVRHFGFSGAPSFEARTMARLGHARKAGPIVEYYSAIPPTLVGTRYLSTVPVHFAREMTRLFALKSVPLPFDFPGQTMLLQWNPHLDGNMAALWLKSVMLDVAIQRYGCLSYVEGESDLEVLEV